MREWWQNAHEWGPWAGFGFGRRGRFFEFGEVRLALLSLLSEGPKHGYQLMKEMAERSGGVYRASAGSIYPTLQQLEDEGLITSERREGRRVYSLTEEGRTELERDPEAVRRIWERAGHWEDWSQFTGPEVMTFIGPLAQLFRASMRAARRPGREERIREILDRARREMEDLEKR